MIPWSGKRGVMVSVFYIYCRFFALNIKLYRTALYQKSIVWKVKADVFDDNVNHIVIYLY